MNRLRINKFFYNTSRIKIYNRISYDLKYFNLKVLQIANFNNENISKICLIIFNIKEQILIYSGNFDSIN